MSSFTKFASIHPVLKEDRWITTNELEYFENDDLTGKKWTVPCWFKTDGCTIPICIFGPKISPKTIAPCVLHDYLWESRAWFIYGNIHFYKWLRAVKVSKPRRIIYFLWVTLFWWIPYYVVYYIKEIRLWMNKKY